jgi:chromosome segregation ATPase
VAQAAAAASRLEAEQTAAAEIRGRLESLAAEAAEARADGQKAFEVEAAASARLEALRQELSRERDALAAEREEILRKNGDLDACAFTCERPTASTRPS